MKQPPRKQQSRHGVMEATAARAGPAETAAKTGAVTRAAAA
jgi:hypothetical protein